ncbi:MAG: hydroxymethylglutaryl-CoA synthase family protein [Nitrososphaerota archaeon]|nr:hydroxymethylglutaryl-CoA synthase family protein [Nitrososphaerota archaeon]MDG6923947.1 hydroxymethylglutaryl-CoA synthase family protein [Nitrososphaerota archaeon]
MKVGIDALYVHTPELYVDNAELAIARGREIEHFVEGIGIRTFSVPPPNEDQVSMAATAAYRLMEKYKVEPEDIFRIDTPTESSLDNSRASVSDVVGMLEQIYGKGRFSHILGYEQKFACVSGVERYLDSASWFAANWNPRKYALVIASDVAKYQLNSVEEPTQGAAAVAMLISENPRLLEIVPKAFGSAMRHERRDFKKPGGRTIALVHGATSVASYLSEMKEAWLNFKKANASNNFIVPENGRAFFDYVDRGAYHDPNKKMVMMAHASLLIHEWRDLPKLWSSVVSKIGPEPNREGMTEVEYYMSKKYNEFRRAFMKTEEYMDDLNRKIGSGLVAPDYVGNSYSASVFVSLNSILENDKEDLGHKTVILAGYGSGSHAVLQANIFGPDCKKEAKKLDLMSRIKERKKLSIEEYEMMHRGEVPSESYAVLRKQRFVLESTGKTGTNEEGDRKYAFVN